MTWTVEEVEKRCRVIRERAFVLWRGRGLPGLEPADHDLTEALGLLWRAEEYIKTKGEGGPYADGWLAEVAEVRDFAHVLGFAVEQTTTSLREPNDNPIIDAASHIDRQLAEHRILVWLSTHCGHGTGEEWRP